MKLEIKRYRGGLKNLNKERFWVSAQVQVAKQPDIYGPSKNFFLSSNAKLVGTKA